MVGKILVVEDDEDVRELLRTVLEAEGYAVLTAVHGQEALALLLNPNGVALLALDCRLPVLDAWGFVKIYRSDPAYASKQVPIIAVTAAAHAAEWAAQIGAVAYIAKPFSLADVRATVRAFLAPTGP